MALREIFARFGVEVDSKELHGLDHLVSEVGEKLKEFGEVILGALVVEGLHRFIEGQVEAASAIVVTSEKLGIGTDELQRFNFAANMAHVSAEAAATGLKFLSKHVGEAAEGTAGASQMFAKMGVQVKKLRGQGAAYHRLAPRDCG
jgi:hypothetical protein